MRILFYIFGLNIGGAETYIENILKKINIEEYHIDFALQDHNNHNIRLLRLCKEKHCRIIYVEKFYKNPFRSYYQIKDVILDGKYDLVHVHANAFINVLPIIASVYKGIPVVFHSHNTSSNFGAIGNIIHKINRNVFAKKVYRVACGEKAGKWMFKNLSFDILNNAIDLNTFKFSQDSRNKIRSSYKIKDNQHVIGHIGRFVEAKNHDFIIKCFSEYIKKDPDALLMLVGDGNLKESIINQCKDLNIQNKVIFTGDVNNPANFYSSFDCLLFPSVFEGLPFTLVEAQASGLKIIASQNVTADVDVTGNIKFIKLDSPIGEWVKALEKCMTAKNDRSLEYKRMIGSIYDIDNEVKKLEKIYDKLYTRK